MNVRTMLMLAALLCAKEAVAHGGLADLSVYDRMEGRRVAVHWHEGRAYVVGKPGNEYRVTLRNRLNEDLLAVVSVDDVNVVSGETENPAQTGYVLPGRQSYDILRKKAPQPIAAPQPKPEARREAAAPESAVGTGHGRRETSSAEYASFERATAWPAETLVLYYDTYANLVARGVIRDSPPIGRLPRPFPGFVPDPRG